MGLRTPTPQKQPPAPLPEYDLARKRTEQRANAANTQQQEALQRRLAAGNMLNSGAAIKQQAIQAEAGQAAKQDARASSSA